MPTFQSHVIPEETFAYPLPLLASAALSFRGQTQFQTGNSIVEIIERVRIGKRLRRNFVNGSVLTLNVTFSQIGPVGRGNTPSTVLWR